MHLHLRFKFFTLIALLFCCFTVFGQADCSSPGEFSVVPENILSGSGTSADPYVVCGNNDALIVTSNGVVEGTNNYDAPALVFAIYTQQPSSSNPSGTGATGVILSNDEGVVFDNGIANFSNASLDYGTYVIVPVIVPDSTSNVLIPEAECSAISTGVPYPVITILNPGENAELCCAGTSPENDDCSGALALSVGSQGPFNNSCASPSGEACDDWFGLGSEPIVENSLWFSIAGNGFDITIASGECSDFAIGDTQFALFEGSCEGAMVACAEDIGPGNLYSEITFASQAGVNYYLLVDGWGGAVGDYCLEVSTDAPDCTDSDLAADAFIECVVDVNGENTGFATLQVEPSGGAGDYIVNVTPEIVDLFDGDTYDFTITVTDADGCSVNIDIEGTVDCPFCGDTDIVASDYLVCPGQTITISPPDGLIGETITVGPGSYTLEYFDENGCLVMIEEAGVQGVTATLETVNQICELDENGNNTGFGFLEVVIIDFFEQQLTDIIGLPADPIADGEDYNLIVSVSNDFCDYEFEIVGTMDCPAANPCIDSDLDAAVSMVCQTDENGQNTGFAMLEVTPSGGAGDYNVMIMPEPELLANGDFYGYTVVVTDADGCELAINTEGLVSCPGCDDDVPTLAVDAFTCPEGLFEFAPPFGCVGETQFFPPGIYFLEYFDEAGCPCTYVDLLVGTLDIVTFETEQVCLKDSLGFNTGFGTLFLTIVDLFGEEITDIEGLPDEIPHGEEYDYNIIATSSNCSYELNVAGIMECPPEDACENSGLEINAFFGCDIDAQGNLLGTATLFVEALGGFGEVELIGATSGEQLENGAEYSYDFLAIDEIGCTAELLFEGVIECEPTINCDFTVTVETTPACAEEVGFTGSVELNIEPEGDYIITWSDNIGNGTSADGLSPGEYEVSISSVSEGAVSVIYNADFDGNGGDWELNVETGENNEGGNIWTISDAENGENIGDCGAAFGGDNTLHVTCTSGIICGSGALYNATTTSNVQANSPSFDISGYNNVTMTFDYIGYGELGEDYPTLLYSTDNGVSWLPFAENNPPTQSLCCDFITGGIIDCSEGLIVQGVWTESVAYSVPEGTTNVAINWTNNGDNEGVDPSFAIDNILITGEQTGEDCTETIIVVIEAGDQPTLDEIFIPIVCIDNPFVDLDLYTPTELNGVAGTGVWYDGADASGEVISGLFEVKDGDILYYEFTSDFGACTDGVSTEINVNDLPELDLELICETDENGGNTGQAILFYEVTTDSDAFVVEGLPEQGTIFNDGDEYSFEVLITDADGCSSEFNIAGVIECPAGVCEIELGDMPQDEIILCNNGVANAQISSVSLPDNADGYYAIHTLSGDDAPGEILATNDNGEFDFNSLSNGAYYATYYLSYVATSPECGTVVSQGPSVIWVAPIEVLVTQDCEESTNFYSFDMIFNFTGGLPQLDPENYFYTVAGTINGDDYAFGGTYSIGVLDLEPYFVEVEDDLGCSAEASGVFDPCSKTAIELVNFNAIANGGNNLIEWATASEYENAYFEITRSTNGYDFETLSRVDGAGTTNLTNTYSYVDERVIETAFYQLLWYDYNGNISKSEVVIVERTGNLFEIVNVDASVNVNIQLLTTNSGSVYYEIFNVNGQLAKAGNFEVISGRNTAIIQDFNPQSGMYFIRLNMGNQAVSKSILIAR